MINLLARGLRASALDSCTRMWRSYSTALCAGQAVAAIQGAASTSHGASTSVSGLRANSPPQETPQELGRIQPQVAMAFTCTHCSTRTVKTFSRQSYETGVVVVRCPGCEKQHLIADHLGWFGQKGWSVHTSAAASSPTSTQQASDVFSIWKQDLEQELREDEEDCSFDYELKLGETEEVVCTQFTDDEEDDDDTEAGGEKEEEDGGEEEEEARVPMTSHGCSKVLRQQQCQRLD